MRLGFPRLVRRARPPVLGVDLSASSVKLVELSRSENGGFRVEHYAIEALDPSAIVDGNVEVPELAADSLMRALRRSGSKARRVALALPAGAVITRKLVLPAGLHEEDYEIQVESEASQYIPFPIDEVNLDFQILGPTANSQGDVDVLLAASRKEKVVDRVAIAEMAGLEPVVMDAEPFVLRLAFDRLVGLLAEGGRGEIVALFSIGQSSTSLTVVLDGQTVFEREQGFGGQQLTHDIARMYGLSLEEAESRKRTGELPENYQDELVQPFIEQGAADVARALQFFFTSTPYMRVDRILLAGGSSVLPGLAEAVAQRCRVPAALLDPFEGMAVSPSVRERQLRLDAPSLMVATGLAMRRFDA